MKKLTIGLFITVLVGCASSDDVEQEKNVDVWFAIGEARAKNGFLLQTESRLVDRYPEEKITTEFYNGYVKGHEAGTKVYCSQNPYILGLSEEPYFGLCDQIDSNYSDEYQKGKKHKKE